MLTLLFAWTIFFMAPTVGPELQASQGQEQDQNPPRYIKERQFQLKDLQVEELKLGEKLDKKLKTWVMDTDAKRSEGLMFVLDGDMTQDQSMIFVFKDPEVLRFWMKNTYIPLDIAYLDSNGYIVKTWTMVAFDTFTDYTSIRPAKYALEMKQGTIKRLNLLAGQKIEIPAKVKAKE